MPSPKHLRMIPRRTASASHSHGLTVLLSVLSVLTVLLSGCTVEMADRDTQTDTAVTAVQTEYDVAFFTDGSPLDSAENAAIWQAVNEYATAYKAGVTGYVPENSSYTALRREMETAIGDYGADILVCYGSAAEIAVYELQDYYSKAFFILIGGTPHAADLSDYRCDDNVCSLQFAPEQLGFLAGFLSVADGYYSLGIMAGMKVPDQAAYMYGFVQGVSYAYDHAVSFIEGIDIYARYSGAIVPSDTVKLTVGGWYTNGVQSVFACGGVEQSAIDAAVISSAMVTGLDISAPATAPAADKAAKSDTKSDTKSEVKDNAGSADNGSAVNAPADADASAAAADTAGEGNTGNADNTDNTGNTGNTGNTDDGRETKIEKVGLRVLSLHEYAAPAVSYALKQYYNEQLPSGTVYVGMEIGAIGIDTETAPLTAQAIARYRELLTAFAAGQVTVLRNLDPDLDLSAAISSPVITLHME